ncbi:Succinate--CoA ligase [ADP-forming] subunit beta [Geodia barretti]|uniref:Succinate--CoA ligase [ADP-forming] subunit beta, mitochondrial n=1 Tax=Geodia barretti TaxID=519541 RepID=A0AA35WF37_GEOBA|nr:Succinate--CoA ligase [ADP-forming] subunit beta [Geodia barretti]
MKLHEYQAKEIFARYGIDVPRGIVANTPEEARSATQELGGQAVVKAQVHAGGRGQAGGIKVVRSPEEAEEAARGFIGRNLVTRQTDAQGVPINSVLIEELADIRKELYVALTIDRGFRGPVMIVSASGGMDIEEVAASNPDDIHTEPIEPVLGLMPYQARRLVARLGLEGAQARPATQVLNTLYRIFTENDCSLVEINPLIITGDDRVVALDAKLDVEDDSLKTRWKPRPRTWEIAYVNLEGSVGCLVNGAGLAMATLDVTNAAGAAPANFLDVGGGADEEKVASAVSIILSDPKVDRVLVNIFGGILRCDIAARGIVLAFERLNSELPLIVRMLGTNVDEGKEILGSSSLNVTFADTLTEAAQAIRRAV